MRNVNSVATAAATTPTLGISPTSVAFGNVAVNTTKQATVTLTNTSSGSTSGITTVNFDSPLPSGNKDNAITGTFDGINFGSGAWFWGGAYGADATNNIYFATSSATSASFSFASAQVFNGLSVATTTAGTLTLSDNLGQTKSASIPTGSLVTVSTGWTKASTTVTVKFTGGWNAVFDNLSYGTSTSTGTNITVSALKATGTGFSVSGLTLPATIAPGKSATFTVKYAPTTTVASSGSVTITSNAANPSATVALTGTGVVAHTATVTWTASTSSVVGYNIYRGTSSAGPFTKLNASPVASASYTDGNVTAGATYYYCVTSVNSAGTESSYSNVASVTVP